jgi:hypothetical protein
VCYGKQAQCNVQDPLGGDARLYAQNWSLPRFPSDDPWYDLTNDATHRNGSQVYFGDVYKPPTINNGYIGDTPGLLPMDPTGFSVSGDDDNDVPVAGAGGGYMIVEGYIAFPAYAKSITMSMWLWREEYVSVHLGISANGTLTRNRSEWRQIIRGKANLAADTTYYSGDFDVPCNAFGRWVAFALVLSDGTQRHKTTLYWSIDGKSEVEIPPEAFSSKSVGLADADCLPVYGMPSQQCPAAPALATR